MLTYSLASKVNSQTLYILDSFDNEDGVLTNTWISGRRNVRELKYEGSLWELVVNMLIKSYGPWTINSPLMCNLLREKKNRKAGSKTAA